MSKKHMAWPTSLWAAIGREMEAPAVPLIIDECRTLYKAVFPHQVSARLAVTEGGRAYWKDVTDSDALLWNIALTGWGCSAKNTGAIAWSDETAALVTRVGLWVWSRAPDGALPVVLAASSTKRRVRLLAEQAKLEEHPIWGSHISGGTLPDHRRMLAEAIPTTTARETQVIQLWCRIYDELKWKSDTVPKLTKWFEKRPVIPPHTRQLWLDAWAGNN